MKLERWPDRVWGVPCALCYCTPAWAGVASVVLGRRVPIGGLGTSISSRTSATPFADVPEYRPTQFAVDGVPGSSRDTYLFLSLSSR